jgi:hypothetical protein
VAPEAVAELVVYTLDFSGDHLVSTVERVATGKVDEPLFVSWDADQPSPYLSIGGGVAFVRGNAIEHLAPAPGEPNQSGPLTFSLRDPYWYKGVAIVAILPPGFTLRSANPGPIGAKVFHDRVAVLWRPPPDNEGQGNVSATLDELRGETRRAVHRINAELATGWQSGTSESIRVEGLKQSTERIAIEATNPWKSGSFYLLLLIVAAAVIVGVVLALGRSSPYIVSVAILSIIVLIMFVGALQLRNDRVLSSEHFLRLVGTFWKGFAHVVGGGRTGSDGG